MAVMTRPRIGISACLIGNPVRFNGDHKRQDWIVDELAQYVDLSAVCPEMSMGLGAPREAMRLERGGRSKGIRLVTSRSGQDHTELAEKTSASLLLKAPRLDGFILKKDSPSCGLERVKVYSSGAPTRDGQGIFAKRLRSEFPLLPIIEEGRLFDPAQRGDFVMRVFAYHRLCRLQPKMASLQKFHQRYKLILMEHSPVHYSRLGTLVGKASKRSVDRLIDDYASLFMEALSVTATARKRVNVLHHAIGYLKDRIEAKEKQQLLEVIEEYRKGFVPLIAPLTLLHHLVKKFSISYLEDQFFFDPYPRELSLKDRL